MGLPGDFNAADQTLLIPSMGLSAPVPQLMSAASGGQANTVQSSSGAGHRRLPAQPDANSLTLDATVEFPTSMIAYMSLGAETTAAALLRAQLQEQMQREVIRLITA